MRLSILMPWGGDVEDEWRLESFEWVKTRYQTILPEAELVIGTSHLDPFSRSEARNDAFSRSTGDILIVVDADTFGHREQIEQAVVAITNGAPWVIPYGHKRYYNLSMWRTADLLKQMPAIDVPEPTDPEEWEHKLDSWAGMLVLPRSAWEKVGGYCTEFIGWGAEDNAFRFALDRHVGVHHRADSWIAHLWHPRGEADFSQPHWAHNAALLEEFRTGIR